MQTLQKLINLVFVYVLILVKTFLMYFIFVTFNWKLQKLKPENDAWTVFFNKETFSHPIGVFFFFSRRLRLKTTWNDIFQFFWTVMLMWLILSLKRCLFTKNKELTLQFFQRRGYKTLISSVNTLKKIF